MRQHLNFMGRQQRGGLGLVLLLMLGLVTGLLGVRAHGQALSGITGTVADTNGAVVPGAQVILQDQATGTQAHAVTNSVGTYALTGLKPDSYSLTVEAPGFHRYVRSGVRIEVGTTPTVDVRLNPGSVSQTVEVKADSLALDTTQPQLGTTLEPSVLNALPIELSGNARQIDQFVFLAPGVQGSAWSKEISGGINFESGVDFNGIPLVQPNMQGQQTYINPPFEMVDEFRVERSTFSSQYGLAQGVVTYSMASGTNRLHGDAFEINRNSFFDSDGFFPSNFNAQGKPIPPVDHQNNYGFTLGGPVVLPHLYDGRYRTFFLFSGDWFNQNQALTSIGTVPTAAMKRGDFSNFVDSTDKQIPIYDPQTGQQFQCNGQLNVICSNRFSALAKTILPLIPDPDRTGTNYGLQSNKSPTVTSAPLSENLWGFTVDHTISASQSIHYSQWEDNQITKNYGAAPIVPISNPIQSEMNDYNYAAGYLLNYEKTVTPNLVSTAGIAWLGKLDGQANGNQNVSFSGVQDSNVFPGVSFNGQNAITSWGVNSGLLKNSDRQLGLSVVNNWMWTKGRNTFNIGGEFRRSYDDTLSCTQCGGQFNFSNAETSTPNPSDSNFGSDGSSFASFLLGLVDSASRVEAYEMALRNLDFSSYIQDDIKVTPRLTVNAGLRWDVMVPFTEKHNEIVFLNEQASNPGAGGLPGAASIFGHCPDCVGFTRANIDWKHFGPRLGFAYSLNQKTVLQAGAYLVFLDGGAYEYGSSNVSVNMGNVLFGEFNRQSTGSNTPGYGDWDSTTLQKPPAISFNPSMANGGNITYFNRNLGIAPYDQAWTVSIQREIPWNMFLTLAYLGNRDIHLPSQLNPINQPNPSILRYGSLLSQPVNSPAAQAAGIQSPYPNFMQDFGGGATVEQALRPFPQYAGIQNLYDMTGTFFYNSFQVQAEKRLSNGLSYLASMDFDRQMSNFDRYWFTGWWSNPLNKYNQRQEWSVSAFDPRYQAKFAATYQLPLGKGEAFLNRGGLMGELVGGWQVSGIADYEGGTPFGVSENGSGINGNNRPNVVAGVRRQTYGYSRVHDYFMGTGAIPMAFSTAAFAPTVSQYVLGDSARIYGSLREPSQLMEDLDAIKHFNMGENVRASLRVDYFNAFNRTRFNNPDNNISDGSFGEVTGEGSQIINRQGQVSFRVEF